MGILPDDDTTPLHQLVREKQRKDKTRLVVVGVGALAIGLLMAFVLISFFNRSATADKNGQEKVQAQVQASQNAGAANTNKSAAETLCNQIKTLGRECAVNPQTLPTPIVVPGPTGEPGINGQPGINGLNGSAGPSGPIGPSGAPGVNGTNGNNGADGQNGKDGADSVVPGPTGPPGPPCPDGYTRQPRDQPNGETWLVCVKTVDESPSPAIKPLSYTSVTPDVSPSVLWTAGGGCVMLIGGFVWSWALRRRENT